MMHKIITELLAPLLRRVGSMGAGALVAYGADAEQVAMVEAGLAALGLIAIDLAVSHWNRKGK